MAIMQQKINMKGFAQKQICKKDMAHDHIHKY